MINCDETSISGLPWEMVSVIIPLSSWGIGLVAWFINTNIQKANEHKCEILDCIRLVKEKFHILRKKRPSPDDASPMTAREECNTSQTLPHGEGATYTSPLFLENESEIRFYIRGCSFANDLSKDIAKANDALIEMRKHILKLNILLASVKYPSIEDIEKKSKGHVDDLCDSINELCSKVEDAVCDDAFDYNSVNNYLKEGFCSFKNKNKDPINEIAKMYKDMDLMSQFPACLWRNLKGLFFFLSKKEKEEKNPPKS